MEKELDTTIRAALIRQEHRLVWVVINFIKYSSSNSNTDDEVLGAAAREALIWRVFSPSTVAVFGFGFVSLVTLALAFEANRLVEQQNEQILVQNQLIESQRRASLNIELSSIMDQISSEAAVVEGREEVVRGTTFVWDRARKSNVENMLVLSPITEARIIAISRALKPYRSLVPQANGDTYVVSRKLSPERGQLVVSLYSAHVFPLRIFLEGDFSFADLAGAYLRSAYLGGNLSSADFSQADLIGCDFSLANLRGANFHGADLRMCDFGGADMSGADFSHAVFTDANFEDADLSEAILNGADFRGVRDLNTDQVLTSRNWEHACFSRNMAESLGLNYKLDCG